MRPCRHCSHQSADHLAFCVQCGRRLAASGGLPSVAGTAGRPPGRTPPAAPFTAALSPTMVAAPRVTTGPGFAAPLGGTHPFRPSRIRWAGDSIGYIYVYMRGKLDAGERRRRLLEERAGAEALLASALTEV